MKGDAKYSNVLNDIIEIIKQTLKKQNIEECKEFELLYNKIIEYSELWNRQYYKLGLKDGMLLRNELYERKNKNGTYKYDYNEDFEDNIEIFKARLRLENKKYRDILEKIKKIKEDNPNIDELISDKKDVPLNKEQKEKIADLVSLITDKDMIELSEALKLVWIRK